jgi:hypothetical protein
LLTQIIEIKTGGQGKTIEYCKSAIYNTTKQNMVDKALKKGSKCRKKPFLSKKTAE